MKTSLLHTNKVWFSLGGQNLGTFLNSRSHKMKRQAPVPAFIAILLLMNASITVGQPIVSVEPSQFSHPSFGNDVWSYKRIFDAQTTVPNFSNRPFDFVLDKPITIYDTFIDSLESIHITIENPSPPGNPPIFRQTDFTVTPRILYIFRFTGTSGDFPITDFNGELLQGNGGEWSVNMPTEITNSNGSFGDLHVILTPFGGDITFDRITIGVDADSIPAPTHVPDTGNSVFLLACGLGVLGGLTRFEKYRRQTINR